MVRRARWGTWATCVFLTMCSTGVANAATGDVVLYSSDATNLYGNWARGTDATAAGGQFLASADKGWSSPDRVLIAPADYFDVTFSANAGTKYHVWMRLRATGNSKYNDSVFVQFSDAVDAGGAPLYRIGTATGLDVNLQSCNGCALAGWGWMDGAYWLSQPSTLQFAASGTHTLRVQTREDGVQIDQIVLSPSTYLTSPPGPKMSDATIVPKPVAGPTPFHMSAVSVPGTIQAEDFDDGGEGFGYHDVTAGNSGGAYRATDVDIEPATDGAYDIGWISAGEWLSYSVTAAKAGVYLFEARVACNGKGGTFHLETNGVKLTGPIQVPATGGWQAWQTVSAVVSLPAGAQRLKLVFDTAGANGTGNITWFRFTTLTSTPYSGTAIALPGSFPATNFDNGGEGLGYHDTTTGNAGGAYRSTDVDIEAASFGGNDVGWIDAGEWLAYSVNVAAPGAYTVTVQVASPFSTGQLHARFGAIDTASVTIPNTGSWQNWTNVVINATLDAGAQTMKLVADAAGFNIGKVTVQAVPLAAPASAPAAAPPAPSAPVTTGSTISVHPGDNLQAAIDRAMPGDTLLLDAGATFTGNFILPAKSGSDFVTIRSSAPDASLPGATMRIDPSYAALLPKLVSPNSLPALSTEAGAHHYRLLALEFPPSPLGYYDLLDLGDGSSAQSTLASVPHDFVLDRLYLHGSPSLGQKRAIGLNSASTTIENCYISEIKAIGQDSQGIAGWNGPGPYAILNNYIEAAAENILFGGSDPAIPNLVPSNITIMGNYLTKQLAWRGQHWEVKNSLELKSAAHVRITGNTIENSWADAQAGFIVVFTVRDQDGTAPWSTIADVTFTNNVVRHGGAFVNILGLDDAPATHPSVRMDGLEISGNLVYDIDAQKWNNPLTGQWAVGRSLQILGGPKNLNVSHNTIVSSNPNTSPNLNSAITIGQVGDVYKTENLTVNNNVMAEGDYGIAGDTVGAGVAALNAYAPWWVWNGNVMIRGNSGMNYVYPASTTLNATGIPVLDASTFGVLPGFASTPTTDGKTTGADVQALRTAIPGLDLTK